jgi:uncharacterized phiE125 gp8 family phage protein
MTYRLITAPAVEPVSLQEAKLHLRQDDTADDDTIRNLITAVRLDIETLCLHALITQTWELYLDAFPGSDEIKLDWPPLQSVTGIYYTPNSTGVEATFASANYLVDTYSTPGKIKLQSTASWPGDQLIEMNGVRIRFVCGFGDEPSDVDSRIRQAILLLLGHYYENREAVFMGRTAPVLLPLGVNSLCWEYRAKMVKF